MKHHFLLHALGSLALLSGCSKNSDGDERATAPVTTSESHAHTAPHGGTLVELGNHHLVLEFVHDPQAGKLTGYLLDAHAENFVRTPLAAINVVITRGGAPSALTLRAVENPATGETVGNSAEFAVVADVLKGTGPLHLTIPIVMIRERTFTQLSATVTAPRG